MMEYGDFYDIAVYANDTWKGNFSKKEIACNAFDYWSDFEYCKANRAITEIIRQLIDKLLEDYYDSYSLETDADIGYWIYNLFSGMNGINPALDAKFAEWKGNRKFLMKKNGIR